MNFIIHVRTWLVRHPWLLTSLYLPGMGGWLLPFIVPGYPFLAPFFVGIWAMLLLLSFFISFPIFKRYTILLTVFELGCLVAFLLGLQQVSSLLQLIGCFAISLAIILSAMTIFFSDYKIDLPQPWDPFK